MNSRRNVVGIHALAIALAAAVCCGCPPEKRLQPQVRVGYWVMTTYGEDGKIRGKNGLKLNPDGTVALYAQNDNPVPGFSWEQLGDAFTYKTDKYTFSAAVVVDDYLEGIVAANSNPSTPVLSFIMRFVSPDIFGLPRVSEGHWRFVTDDLVNGINEYAVKLNANGTVDESPAGAPFFPLDEVVGVWSDNKSEFRLEFYDQNNTLLLRLVTLIDASNFLEGPHGVQGEFRAQLDPTIVDANAPTDQAPIN